MGQYRPMTMPLAATAAAAGGGGDVLWMHLASSTAATVPTGPRLRPTASLGRYALRYFSESMGGARDIANNYGSQVCIRCHSSINICCLLY